MLKDFTIANLLDLNETIAKDLFEGKTYPWEVLPEIGDFILKLGQTLSEEEYDHPSEDVWIAKSAKVAPTACINGPVIIGKEAEVRHCAFIRGKEIINLAGQRRSYSCSNRENRWQRKGDGRMLRSSEAGTNQERWL